MSNPSEKRSELPKKPMAPEIDPKTTPQTSPTGIPRRSSIPVPIKSPRNAMTPRKVEEPSTTVVTSDTHLGITESTPSFLTFTNSLDAVGGCSHDDCADTEGFPLVHLPTVDDIAIGEGRPTGISTSSKSFKGFMTTRVVDDKGVVPPGRGGQGQLVDPVLNLTRGEKFQTTSQTSQSKNEKHHRKHRRLRLPSFPALSEEQFLRRLSTPKGSVYQDAKEVRSEISMFRLVEPIHFPEVESKRELKEILEHTKIPGVFTPSMLPKTNRDHEKYLDPTALPVNLKQLSQHDLEPLFVTGDEGIGMSPVKMTRHIEMFPTHDGDGFMGCLFVQNKSPHVLTFRVQASVDNRYKVNSAIGQISIGSGSLIFVQTLDNQQLTYDDIQDDRFLVNVIPLTRSFQDVPSCVKFWKYYGLPAAKFKFVVELGVPVPNPLMTSVHSEWSKVKMEKRFPSGFARSDELFKMRYLEKDMGFGSGFFHSRRTPPKVAEATNNVESESNSSEGDDSQYGLFSCAFVFGFLLMTFMTSVLFS